MDWFPLYNSLRIALIASVIVFFSGIFSAYYIAKLPPAVKGVLDVVLTLPLVLPPTAIFSSCSWAPDGLLVHGCWRHLAQKWS